MAPIHFNNPFGSLDQDVLLLIVKLLDMSSVRNLVVAIPSTQAILESNFRSTISGILENMYSHTDDEMLAYLSTIVGVRQRPEEFEGFHRLMMYYEDGDNFPTEVAKRFKAVKQMASILQAIDFWIPLFEWSFSSGMYDLDSFPDVIGMTPLQNRIIDTAMTHLRLRNVPKELNMSPIILTLLRFQLFCEVFHGPRHCDRNIPAEEQYMRHMFWAQFDIIENEQVPCVLTVIKRYVQAQRSVGHIDGGDGVGFEWGLPQFHRYVDNKGPLLTKRGKVYVEQYFSHWGNDWNECILDTATSNLRWAVNWNAHPNQCAIRSGALGGLWDYLRDNGWCFWEDEKGDNIFEKRYMNLNPRRF